LWSHFLRRTGSHQGDSKNRTLWGLTGRANQIL
jgi:hypothetical protein